MASYQCYYCNYETTSDSELIDHLLECKQAYCLDCSKIESPFGEKQMTTIRISHKGGQLTLGATIHPTCGQGGALNKLVNDSRL